MREIDFRNELVNTAKSFLGYKESLNQDDIIIKKYNAINSNGMYDMTMDDPWCAAFGSVVAHVANLTKIIPIECSCERKIELWKKMGCWEEDGKVIPKIGDYIYYNWDDSTQPNDGWTDHEGIVAGVSSTTITVIEGNKNDAVEYRTISIGWGYIRGYGKPNYASLATTETQSAPTTSTTYALGDVVEFAGNVHYTNSYASGVARNCTAGQAEVTAVNLKGEHPYHLVGINGCSVYGWVNAEAIKTKAEAKPVNTIIAGDKVKVLKAITYTGKSFKVWHDVYDVIQVNGDRVVIGKGKTVTCAINMANIKEV